MKKTKKTYPVANLLARKKIYTEQLEAIEKELAEAKKAGVEIPDEKK